VLADAKRQREVTLDECLLDRLDLRSPDGSPSPDDELVPASIELHAELISPSLTDLEAGRFLLAVSPQGGAPQAGASLGRFAYLLPTAARNCVGLGAGSARIVYAEVVFRPRDPRLGNLVAPTGWASYRIPVGIHDTQPGDLHVRDLAVCADEDRLWLYSEALDRFVEPLCYTMLRPTAGPPAARFLFALASARSGGWRPWRWGPALSLPYRPRIRVGRTILSPASWNIPAELNAAARSGDLDRWREAVAAWRSVSGVPNWLLCGSDDQQLPLNLDDVTHVDLLRRICRRTPAGSVSSVSSVSSGSSVSSVSELGSGLDEPTTRSWLTGPDGPHIAEIVFPLFRRQGPEAHWVSAPSVPAGEHHRTRSRKLEVPGGQWLYAKLFTPPALQDDVLRWLRADLLPTAEDADVDRWFFIRYHDRGEAGGHHLRVRFHGDPARLLDRLLPALHDWTAELCSAGLCRRVTLDTYEPETGFYGGASLIEAAERAFAADSRWVIDLLAGGCTNDPADPASDAPEPASDPVGPASDPVGPASDPVGPASDPVGPARVPEQVAAASLACLAVTLGQWRNRPWTQPSGQRLTPGRKAMVRELTEGTAALVRDLCREPGAWVAAMRGYLRQLDESLPAQDCARIAAKLLHLHQNRLIGGGFADTDVVLALASTALRKKPPYGGVCA
jgi:lantibiotic biosynthesis protein